MSVSRANRLVCNRGRGSWDGATFTAAAKRAATTRWSSCLARPSPQPAAKREGQEEPSKLHREGDSEWLVAGVGGLRTPVVGRLDRSPPSPQLLERVDGGATKAPVWPPSPLLSWVPVPSPQAPCCPLFSPHLSSNSVSLERGWGGWGFSLPGTPGPSLRSLGGQCGLLQSRPVSHGSLNQPHRE